MAETSSPQAVAPQAVNGSLMTKQFEGYRDRIYKDTKGHNTIGYGFNIDEPGVAQLIPQSVTDGLRPITPQESDAVYNVLYQKAQNDAINFVGKDKFAALPPEKQAILTDLAYNLGPNKLGGFVKFKDAVLKGDNLRAASELKDSEWYKQVGNRGKHHVLKWAEE